MTDSEFVDIEDVVGPHIHYNVDPLDHEPLKGKGIGRLVVISENTGLWAVNEKAEAKIKEQIKTVLEEDFSLDEMFDCICGYEGTGHEMVEHFIIKHPNLYIQLLQEE